MSLKIVIRNETGADEGAITEVTVAAFKTLEISSHTEQFIIEALRAAEALMVSLVAEVDGRVVGPYRLLTRYHCGRHPELVRARAGFGAAGAPAARHRQSAHTGGVVKAARHECARVLPRGHLGYYNQFGFKNTSGLVYEGVPEDAFFALSFDGRYPQGTVVFHEGFKADGRRGGNGDGLKTGSPLSDEP